MKFYINYLNRNMYVSGMEDKIPNYSINKEDAYDVKDIEDILILLYEDHKIVSEKVLIKSIDNINYW